jgi:four helix bundle protein
MERKYDLEERLIDFAVRVSDVVDSLPNSRLGNYLSGQMIRSGTSSALHYGEAQSAESISDFIHKMKVVLKELRETQIGLKLIKRKKLSKNGVLVECGIKDNDELVSIFVASIKTVMSNKNKSS